MKKILTGLFLFSTVLVSTAYATERLTATVIGSGSPIFNENRASASVLISAGDTNILVDMGNGTQANLYKLGIKARDLSALLFTHHHLDHNEEFVPMLIGSLLGKRDFSIVGPPNTIKFTETNLDLYKEDIEYRLGKTQRTLASRQKYFNVTDLKGGDTFSIGDIRISTLEVPHTIYTLAYRFDYNAQSIVITGDLTYSDELPGFAKNADFMIIDSGGMIMKDGRGKKRNTKKGNNDKKNSNRHRAHLDLADSSLMAQKANVKTMVYTHFNSTVVDTEASLKEIRKNYSGHVIFGGDLMVLNNTSNVSEYSTIEHAYPIVDTGQTQFYGDDDVLSTLNEKDSFFGQDGNYIINKPSYTDNHDGTITDNITGLMWQKALTEKLSFEEAIAQVKQFKLAGYNDWRISNIKELYSLIQFTGAVKGETAITPFIDTRYFDQPVGNTEQGEREIDAQVWTSTQYVGKTMNRDDTVFGVNFVDGRIKGYPKYNPRSQEANKMYFRLVRDNPSYGKNQFVDNNDGTVTDLATGLMWQKTDSQQGLNWKNALQYSKDLTLAGHDDWRLPNAKELQSIVDYSRSPDTSHSAAIVPIFNISPIKNENGKTDYPYYWTSTTHLDGPVPEANAVYISFGKALGKMHGTIMDVHGAGSQRSDPKTGNAMSRGPQGDFIRVENYVRSVRSGPMTVTTKSTTTKVTDFTEQNTHHINSTLAPISVNKVNEKSQNKFIKRLDKNGDGKVSSSEFKGQTKHFKHLDKNNDGYINTNEAPTGPPKNRQ